jgi:DNA repair exonuclease SbcCD ATPase subunit
LSRKRELSERADVLDREKKLLAEARVLLQKVSTIMRVQISERFAELATSALRFIFQRDDLEFVVDLDVKSNLPVASFLVKVGKHKVDPRTALGGSIYEIIGICLRLVCLEFFNLKGPLILDEPLRSVDRVNLTNALEFIMQYCRATNRQLFIVTHDSLIADCADALFVVTQENGVSKVERKQNG